MLAQAYQEGSTHGIIAMRAPMTVLVMATSACSARMRSSLETSSLPRSHLAKWSLPRSLPRLLAVQAVTQTHRSVVVPDLPAVVAIFHLPPRRYRRSRRELLLVTLFYRTRAGSPGFESGADICVVSTLAGSKGEQPRCAVDKSYAYSVFRVLVY